MPCFIVRQNMHLRLFYYACYNDIYLGSMLKYAADLEVGRREVSSRGGGGMVGGG